MQASVAGSAHLLNGWRSVLVDLHQTERPEEHAGVRRAHVLGPALPLGGVGLDRHLGLDFHILARRHGRDPDSRRRLDRPVRVRHAQMKGVARHGDLVVVSQPPGLHERRTRPHLGAVGDGDILTEP